MTISTQFVTLQVLATLYSTVEALNTATNNKAASQYVNCDCQCSSLTFQVENEEGLLIQNSEDENFIWTQDISECRN